MPIQRNTVIAFALGVVSTAGLVVALGAEKVVGPPYGPASPRYQISSWATQNDHGAYRVDSETGQVLEIKYSSCNDVN